MPLQKLLFVFFLIISGSVVLSGCKKDHDLGQPPPPPVSKKLWKVKTNESDSILLAYTTSGDLFRVITTGLSGESGLTTYTMTYDGSSRLLEISSDMGAKHKFVYENGQIKFSENFQGAQKISENYLEYQEGRITANTLFTGQPDGAGNITYKPTFKTSFTYTPSGDIEKVTTYTLGANQSTLLKYNEKIIEQYDQSVNPLAVLKFLTLLTVYEIPGSKNILREKLYDRNGILVESTNNSFVYDSNKLPVSSTSVITPAGENSTTLDIKYYYK